MAVASLSLLLLSGCKQGVGERCQVQSDCADGLLCVLPAGGTPQSGGSCQMSGAVVDMSSTGDMAVPDMSMPDLTSAD